MKSYVYILFNKKNGTLYTGIEKQIKGGSRQKKLMLIESFNPEWKDLSMEL